jgi:hypothetical protein
MPFLNSLTRIAAKSIPKAVTPKVHGVVDYITIGILFGTVPVFWRRNRRATVASLICGGAELALVLLTDYPCGVKDFISFRAHREIDYGLAAMVATMPESFGLKAMMKPDSFDSRALFARFWANSHNPKM